MSLATPTTQEIADNIVAQLDAALSQTIPLLPKAFTRVLAKALAGVFVLVYRYAGFMFLQLFVAFASMEETEVNGKKLRPLVEWGRLIGVGDPIAATRAEVVVDVTVLEQTGDLPGGSQLLREETGVVYQSIAAVPLDAATVRTSVIASSDQDGNGGVGAIGNLDVGDVISFANPLPNVTQDAVVSSVTTIGADAETVDAYRQRVIDRMRAKPQGGAYADYRVWGEEATGVANVYPYTGTPGEVDVYVEATTDLDPDGIPDSGLLDDVAAAIALDDGGIATRRPANAAVNVRPITRTAFTVVVGGLDVKGVTAAKNAIEEGLDEYFRAREPFIVGLSTLPRLDRITQGAIGGVVNEIISAEGGTVANVRLQLDGGNINAYTLAKGEKAKLDAAGVSYE